MIHDVRLQIKKYAERISVSCIFHIDTVPHALPRFHNPFSSVLVQFGKATVQPRTLCRLSILLMNPSGLAVEVLPQACSKKRVSFSNQSGSLESFAWVLHS